MNSAGSHNASVPSRADAPASAARSAPVLPALLVCAVACKLAAAVLWLLGARGPAALVFFGPDPFVLYALFVPAAQGLCRVFTRFAAEQPSVWLTIDDGPDEQDTPRILDLLDQHQARATFFVVGERAARHPDLVREIVRRGHSIGHHTHTHPAATFWCAPPARLHTELDSPLSTLRGLGIRPHFFRPPVGIKNLLLAGALSRRGLHCVAWTIRSGDCRIHSPERLVAQMVRRLQPGVIILLHEGPSVPQPVRIKGMALLLEAIADRGYRCELPRLEQLR